MANKMTFRERLITWMGGVTRAELNGVRGRSFEAGIEAATTGDDEPAQEFGKRTIRRGYRQTDATPRDLSNWSQERAIEAAYRLWNTNPLAGALTEIVVDYVVGDGVTVTAANPEVQAVLDRFLQDPVNDLLGPKGATGSGLDALVRELGLFGELLVLTFPRDGADVGIRGDGRVRIGTVDPSNIHSIITDARNPRDILAVRLKDKAGGEKGPVYRLVRAEHAGGILEGRRDLKSYRENVGRAREANVETSDTVIGAINRMTIRPLKGKEWIVSETANREMQVREAKESEAEAFATDGECFFFQVNKISTGVRGRPDMLRMIDWLDRFDQLFFDGAEHVALLNLFAWDLQIEGGTADSPEPERNLTQQARKVAGMKPGSVYAHNEKATLEAKNPDLKTQDLETIVRQLRVLIAGGSRFPEHWLGEGGYTNRATASEMGQPTYRMLTRRQAVVQMMLTRLCQYQIDVAVGLGELPEMVEILDDDGEPKEEPMKARDAFEVIMPDINAEDTGLAARAFATVAMSVAPLVVGQLLPKKTALELLASAAALLGVEIDIDKALEEAEGGLGGMSADELKGLIKSLGDPQNPPGQSSDDPNPDELTDED